VYAGIVWRGGLIEIPVTRVGAIAPDSPAAAADLRVGDQILMVGNQPVALWDDILEGVVKPNLERPGDPLPVPLTVLRTGQVLDISLAPRFDVDLQRWVLGLEPWDTRVGLVQRGGPADRIGLQAGDQILALNGEPVTSFSAIAEIINKSGGEEVHVLWERDGVQMQSVVTPELAEILPDSTIGRIFIDRQYVYKPIALDRAVAVGVSATWRTMRATLRVLFNFVAGRLGMEAVGGPIRIGQVAGEMLRWSFGHLMQFIAFFSVNLFLLNLLPIPVLDGGHVLFLLLEVASRRKIPERIQAIATQVGLIILLLFMTFVVVVDVLKVTGH
jgi:regulator of sigma E protease